ncbi:hypothetical protein K461DRAFT_291823 [Myriangium duriaei CBS 260.36]|uniref:F-box domain-containing protein n=1 Tax=Myriangium duriaei CBS 260.36 TaxID=1168546 RepID=A0A9P4J4H3_9PEZI|nr:hypothetical protein K461DRAFT_291823 [Myriangium duriaei CBS 260.36]
MFVSYLDRKSLSAVVRVSRAWSEAGLDVLWRHVESDHFKNIEVTRHEHYARRVRELIVLDQSIQNLSGITFPQLRILHFDLVQYSEAMFEMFATCSSTIEHLTFNIESQHDADTGEQLNERTLECFKSCENLREIVIGYTLWDQPMNDDIYTHLATRRGLRTLRVHTPIRSELIQHLLAHNDGIFTNIVDSHIIGDPASLLTLFLAANGFKHLTSLFIETHDPTESFQARIADVLPPGLLNLTIMYVDVVRIEYLAKSGILALGQFRKLRVLVVMGVFMWTYPWTKDETKAFYQISRISRSCASHLGAVLTGRCLASAP